MPVDSFFAVSSKNKGASKVVPILGYLPQTAALRSLLLFNLSPISTYLPISVSFLYCPIIRRVKEK
jgi:hypothetical protein